MTIETKKLVISEELKRKVELICKFAYVEYSFTNGYIINLKKDVYKRKGEINFNDHHKKKLVDILFWINVFLIFIMLYLIQSGIKLDILFYLLEIIPMITFIVGVSFKSDEKLNSKKDITIGIFCFIFIFLCFAIIDLGEHIGPYKLNDIGKKLDYSKFISPFLLYLSFLRLIIYS